MRQYILNQRLNNVLGALRGSLNNQRLIIIIIINSKYFPVSDWLTAHV